MSAPALRSCDEALLAAQRMLAKMLVQAITKGIRPQPPGPLPARPRLRVIYASR